VQIVELIKKIQGRGSIDIAKRALQKIKQSCRFAVAHGYVKFSRQERVNGIETGGARV